MPPLGPRDKVSVMQDSVGTDENRGRTALVGGLSGLLVAIALGLGDDGWFAPMLALTSAFFAGLGLHRFGRSGPR